MLLPVVGPTLWSESRALMRLEIVAGEKTQSLNSFGNAFFS